MINVQKRKSSCQRECKGGEVATQADSGHQRQASKSSRKRAKFAASSRAQQVTAGNEGPRGGSGGDDSVWIFGLINNIEQILTSFNGNSNSNMSATNRGSSGSSTPISCSLSSSFSSSSPASAPTSSPPYSPAANSAALSATTLAQSSLPRSPISRQIKFHEYKGPPSAKRQQQQQPPASRGQQQASSARQPEERALADTNLAPNEACGRPSHADPATGSLQPAGLQNQNQARPLQQHQVISGSPLTSSTMQSLSHRAGPKLWSSFSQQQQQQQQQRQLKPDYQQQVSCTQSIPVQPQTHTALARAAQLGPNRLTSGAHCGQASNSAIQPFCFSQTTLESTNGPTVLLAPVMETADQQEQSEAAELELQLQLQLQLQLELEAQSSPMQQRPPAGRAQRAPRGESEAAAAAAATERASFCPQVGARRQEEERFACLQEQQATLDRQCEIGRSVSGQRLYQNYCANEVALAAAPADCAPDLLVDGFNEHSLSPTAQLLGQYESPANFGPNSEQTDACEIEPTINFGHGFDELLFSEFIDLQDVPMNVEESDWLKKFLPPCSMG